jgi:hypothetical protein
VPGVGTPQGGAAGAAAGAGTSAACADDGLMHGAALYWQQFKALFVKRMLSARWVQHHSSSPLPASLVNINILACFVCLA